MKSIIRKYALHNALLYNGKASKGAVLGKVLSENPTYKTKIEQLKKEIAIIVSTVNALSLDAQMQELSKTAPELLTQQPKVKRVGLAPLPEADKGVIMRLAPSPSGPLHLGHAYTFSLNSQYCKKYNGRLILRIEDTNPSNIYEPAYRLLEEDAQWVTQHSIDNVIIQSERLGLYYDCAEELITKEHAYVCTCDPEKFRALAQAKQKCECRDNTPSTNSERYHRMFHSYSPGEAVIRLKTNITHKNPAMRDFPLMRINDDPHPRTKKKHRVWPLMILSVAVDDHALGITHTLRGKDHADNEKKEMIIFDMLGWSKPKNIYVGKINFKDIQLSSSKTRALIDEGVYSGWDDIRLPFLGALRRRGYQPEAFISYTNDVGVSLNDKNVTQKDFFASLNSFNKQIIEKSANRFFFVEEPKKITIQNAPEEIVSLALHPDFPKRGNRKLNGSTDIYVTPQDYDTLKANTLYRLMGYCNITKQSNRFVYHSSDLETYKKEGRKIFHWLPQTDDLLPITVLMPDGTKRIGLGEKKISSLRIGALCQFERFGFCQLDHIEKNHYHFWFTHK
jgi:glutamyl-tRNA synthetase